MDDVISSNLNDIHSEDKYMLLDVIDDSVIVEYVSESDSIDNIDLNTNINDDTIDVNINNDDASTNINDGDLALRSRPQERGFESDPEFTEPVELVEGGRKRRKGNKRNVEKMKKYSLEGKCWAIKCNHNEDSKICGVKRLDTVDIDLFFKNIYKNTTKNDQDRYILKFIDASKPSRLRRTKDPTTRKERFTNFYFILTTNGEKIKVCQKSFESITCYTRDRLNRLSRNFCTSLESPLDKRGGDRSKEEDHSVKDSIIQHITSFKCQKSHYQRKDTGRCYLQSDLSVKKMWNDWVTRRRTNGLKEASLSKYYKVFVNCFNLSIGHPRQDVCSFCTENKLKIKSVGLEDEEKKRLSTSLMLHRLKAKKFFELLSTKEDGVITVCFDMMQNQPLPKLNVSDVFYCRQVWLYILNFVICSENDQKKENNFVYSWLETQGGRGPNEIISALCNFLKILEERYKDQERCLTLRLFSDSCAAQNKNQFLIAVLLNFVNISTVFDKIIHYYPVRGHSYMPADRTFGVIERVIRKKKEITSPSQYYDIIKDYCTIKIYGKDFTFNNFKETVKPIMKSTMPFKTTEQKVITYKKGHFSSVGVSSTYLGTPVNSVITKKNRSVKHLLSRLKELPTTSHVKEEKKKDIAKLLKFVNITDDNTKSFYDSVLGLGADSNVQEDENDESFFYEEDNETEDFV